MRGLKNGEMMEKWEDRKNFNFSNFLSFMKAQQLSNFLSKRTNPVIEKKPPSIVGAKKKKIKVVIKLSI